MLEMTKEILDEVFKERMRQVTVCKHGGDTDEFDKSNTQNDWIAYINAYTGRASQKVGRNEKEAQEFRTNMIKAAALCVAALEAYDKGYC